MALLLLRWSNASGRGSSHFTSSVVNRIAAIIGRYHNNDRHCRSRFYLHTNADRMKRDDPYAILGLQWGDGATIAQIKAAYLARAAHPDVVVNTNINKAAAVAQFQKLKQAYEILTKAHSTTLGSAAVGDVDEWRVSLWRNGDRIAVNRTDVAGVSRVRPIPPASVDENSSYRLTGGGTMRYTGNADYIGPSSTKQSPSSVGTGRNKWVEPAAYKPWKRNGDDD
jgi:hypothetical protein